MAAKSAIVVTLVALILPIAVTVRTAVAQSRIIRGVVTDESGAAIPKTSTQISCFQKGHVVKVADVQSRPDGSFQFEAKLIGTYKVNFSAIGFKPLQRPLHGAASFYGLDV